MPDTASIVDLLLGMGLAPAGQEANNRVSLEGVTFGSGKEGALEIGIRRFEASSFRLAAGPFVLEIGHLALQKVVALVRIEAGAPRLSALEAADAELTGVKVQGPVVLPAPAAPGAGAWSLGPLAAADGNIRAQIVDAHLVFDANVTVPIRQGQVDFNQATVEHVGPDSRMGVSRMGLYVDAPNGRSYLYQFPSAPVAGVEYERRGAVLGTRVTDRGKLRLQAFGEAVMRQPAGGPSMGLTDQARLLFDRTAASGEVQLGDGTFAAPGVQADLVHRAEGRNVVRFRSPAVGRGITAEMDSVSVRNALLKAGARQMHCDEAAGVLMLRVFLENAQLRFAFDVAKLKMSGLRLQLPGPSGA